MKKKHKLSICWLSNKTRVLIIAAVVLDFYWVFTDVQLLLLNFNS